VTIPPIDFTPALVAAVAAVVLSLLFTYVPGLRVWYGALTSQVKSLIMLGLMVICAVAITALAQYGVIPAAHPITWTDCVVVVITWLVASQATFTLAPLPNDVSRVIVQRNSKMLGAPRRK
jgi:hypothetical protein